MNKTNIKYIVRNLFEDFDITIPVDLDELANQLGVKVIYDTFQSEGYFINQNNKMYIFINENSYNPQRKRFTLAHEIGHRMLHANSNILQRNVTDKKAIYQKDLKDIEDEANFFASELLCPTDKIKNELPNHSIDNKFIEYIAERYDVSYHVAAIKCVTNSLTFNEVFIFYDIYNEFKWFCSADEFEYNDFPRNSDDLEQFANNIYKKPNIEYYITEGYGTSFLISGERKSDY